MCSSDLEEAKSSKKGTGLALLWLGEIYERVGDPFFAPSADFFWKACISKFPHQFIAKKCFKKIVDFEKRKGLKIDPGERSRLKGLAN